MGSRCSDLIGLVHLMATLNNTLAPENLRKKGNLLFAFTVCTSVKLLPTASIIIVLTAITRLQKSLLMVKCRQKMTSHVLINWKSCVKSRGMKCCESSISEKIARVAATPGTATPETGTPETGTPGTGTPETGTPETGIPETATPETATPETGTPETGIPETATPGIGTNRLLILAVLTQKNRRSGYSISRQA